MPKWTRQSLWGQHLIGLDTSVLARYIVQDDAKQAKAAGRVIDELTSENPGYVSLLVLCELTWVLGHAYGYDKETIIAVIHQILLTAELVVQSPEITWAVLRDYRSSPAGFSDCVIAHHAKAAGCLETLTFDIDAAKHPFFRKI